MDTSYNKEENEYEGMTLDSKSSTPDSPNPAEVIDIDDEMETTEKLPEDEYESKIDRNHSNVHMVWK